METPEVSIVFTSYNHERYLKQALDSLLAQTLTNFELIIVDDCSTDGSQDILIEYANKDSRIKLNLNTKNSGSYVCSTNQGASMATAPYLIFAQCDDWAEPNQLERLMGAMHANDVGVVFSCSNMVDEKERLIGTDFNGREEAFKKNYDADSLILGKDAMNFLLKACIIPNLSAALIKKDLYDDLQGLSNKYFVLADWDFWLRASIKSDFFYIREPLNNFRQHPTTIRSNIKMKRQVGELFYMMFNLAKSKNISKMKACHAAASLWIYWAVNGKKEWIKTFPSLLCEGTKHSAFFPAAFFVEAAKVSIRKVFSSIVKINIHCLYD